MEEIGFGDDAADVQRVVASARGDAGGLLIDEGEVAEAGLRLPPHERMAGAGSKLGEHLFKGAGVIPHDGELAAVAVGEGLQEDAVDEAEDGGGGADADGKGEDGGEGEAGGAADLAEGVAEVLCKVRHGSLLWWCCSV